MPPRASFIDCRNRRADRVRAAMTVVTLIRVRVGYSATTSSVSFMSSPPDRVSKTIRSGGW